MGNHHTHNQHASNGDKEHFQSVPVRRKSSTKPSATAYVPALEKLFQKLELTAEEDNGHPGEITRTTFENVFHGPLQMFGKLLYEMMVTNSHHGHDKIKDRISCEQFVKSGKEVIKLFNEHDQHKYYFKLFSEGKDHLTQDDALVMVNIAYALTLSSSMIQYAKNDHDDRVFQSVVHSMFGLKEQIKFSEMEKWMDQHCPHMFAGVHNWVYTILTGSKIPTEMEVAPVPMLERFSESSYCMSMGTLWMLTATLPYMYTHTKEDPESTASTPTGTRNPLLTSFMFLMKLARLSRCQSWTKLYDSNEHGLSMNRFTHHVTAYNGATITLISFEGRNVYCLAQDLPWREGGSKVGKEDARLIQITPIYRVVKSGGPLVLWNLSDRNLPQGVHMGDCGKGTVLSIPTDFDKVQHYGVDAELHQVQMWGCSGNQTYMAQQKQKQWERKDIEKHQTRKLHLDTNWDENPDRQILSWGGVETNHQYHRDGGF